MNSNALEQPQVSPGDDGAGRNNYGTPEYSAKEPSNTGSDDSTSLEEGPPPLPPGPNTLSLLDEGFISSRSTRQSSSASLQAKATTAVSIPDISLLQLNDGGKENHPTRGPFGALRAKASLTQLTASRGSDAGDSASIRSTAPNTELGEAENVFSDFLAQESGDVQQDSSGLLQFPEFRADDVEDDFTSEFEPIGELDDEGRNEGW
jgi:hypothetical protein